MRMLTYTSIILSLILTHCTVALGEIAWKNQGINNLARNQLWHKLKGFNPPEKPLVIVVTAYNVKNWYKANLSSIFAQKYSNYRVIYIDDCSTDGTPELVEQFIRQIGQAHRVTLIKNKEWRSQMANHYTAAHMCKDNEIVVNVDSDDWLTHEYVLSLLNKVYSYNPHIWLTYGNLEFYPGSENKAGAIPGHILTQQQLRELHANINNILRWNWWHPRTYYAWLFKQVKLQDLLLDGNFKNLSPSPDSAFMYPIMEMAGNHAMFIPDILYVWNLANPLSQGHINNKRQFQVNRIVASWPKYNTYGQPQVCPATKYNKRTADIVIFSTDVQEAENILFGINTYVKYFDKITLLYDKNSNNLYNRLKALSSKVQLIECDQKNIQHVLEKTISNAQEHVVLVQTTQHIKKQVVINDCIRELERTFAFGCYIGLSQDQQKLQAAIPMFVTIAPLVNVWQFACGQGLGKNMYSLDFVLYRKQDIHPALKKINYKTLAEFVKQWYALNKNTNEVGRKAGLIIT